MEPHNDFDGTARALADLEPHGLLAWLATRAGLTLTFHDWFPERSKPRPAGLERIADQVAALNDATPPVQPWLFVLEWQTEPDDDKLDVLLEEAGILRSRARLGPERQGKYLVLPILIHLTGRAPQSELDQRTPTGIGSYQRPLLWDIGEDSAATVLDQVAAGAQPWVLLFWLPLMQGANDAIIVQRWLEVVLAKAPAHRHGDLREAALIWSSLAGIYPVWEPH